MLDKYTRYKSCKIIYGYEPGCLEDKDILDSQDQDQLVILIEPRTDRIDQIQSLKRKDFTLIKKVLVKTNVLMETILYNDKDRDSYFMKGDDLVINGTNLFNVKKYQVYTTSMENIIKEYTIQNIHSLIININIENCNEIIQSIEDYNHILSRIYINKQIVNYHCKILDNFYCEKEINKILDSEDKDKPISLARYLTDDKPISSARYLTEDGPISSARYLTFAHKNLHIELPKIVVYFCETQNKRLKELTLLMQQYKMALVVNKSSGDNVVPYPESIKYINNIQIHKPSKIYYENIINNLECIFDTFNSSVRQGIDYSYEFDIIIQFNQKYFDSKNTLQIMYPLQDNVLYINRVFDIIYGTKNCMFMLYQILKSKYFTDYIEEKIIEKKTLFKIFSKRYFYDYISKIFVIKDI